MTKEDRHFPGLRRTILFGNKSQEGFSKKGVHLATLPDIFHLITVLLRIPKNVREIRKKLSDLTIF
jgi:hypothetical protein